MPTPAEQKALAFLAIVILLGGTVRVLRAGAAPWSEPSDVQALVAQSAAVESAGARKRANKGSAVAKRARSRRDGAVDTVAGVAGVPFSDVRPDRPGRPGMPYNPPEGWVNGFPPPLPRIDTGNRQTGAETGAPDRGAGSVIDLDVASAADLERLPRVGPALAARLVANRDSFGPFRSLDGLRRVKGMGPATLARLAGRVTFSGRAASSTAGRRDR
jgi:DNA uptake protein ComE-like DNA-binding protein